MGVRGKGPGRVSRATAFHEAGHAVQGFVDGGRIIRVSAIPDHDSAGHTLVRFGKLHSANGLLRVPVICCWGRLLLAGSIAERKQGRRVLAAASADRIMAVGWAEKICRTEAELMARLRLWKAQAEASMDENWHLVEALAEALMRHGSLSGEEAGAVIGSAWERRLKALLGGVSVPSYPAPALPVLQAPASAMHAPSNGT